MIENQKEYEITKWQQEKFVQAVKEFSFPPNSNLILVKAELDALWSVLSELTTEIAIWETKKSFKKSK